MQSRTGETGENAARLESGHLDPAGVLPSWRPMLLGTRRRVSGAGAGGQSEAGLQRDRGTPVSAGEGAR